MDEYARRKGFIRGNFPNYYEFNPPENRMQVMNDVFWKRIVQQKAEISVLDVGCNDGTLTNIVRQKLLLLGARSVASHGVDIDEQLIDKARCRYPDCRFSCCDFMVDDVSGNYDIVLCFGTTMWIHLNYGDNGLKDFIQSLCNKAKLSLVIEPQNWRSYKTAKRRLRKVKADVPESFKTIRVKGDDDIRAIILSIAEESFASTDSSSMTTNWDRTIFYFYDKRERN